MSRGAVAIYEASAKRRRNNAILDSLGALVIPIAAAAFFIWRHFKGRKKAAAAAAAAGQRNTALQVTSQSGTPAARSKPRREYKVRRDRHEAAEAHQQQQLEAARAAVAAAGKGSLASASPQQGNDVGQQRDFVQMLREMGFQMMANQVGSGQMVMMSPGQKGMAVPEGDAGSSGRYLRPRLDPDADLDLDLDMELDPDDDDLDLDALGEQLGRELGAGFGAYHEGDDYDDDDDEGFGDEGFDGDGLGMFDEDDMMDEMMAMMVPEPGGITPDADDLGGDFLDDEGFDEDEDPEEEAGPGPAWGGQQDVGSLVTGPGATAAGGLGRSAVVA